jgi:predicted aminopeptidase
MHEAHNEENTSRNAGSAGLDGLDRGARLGYWWRKRGVRWLGRVGATVLLLAIAFFTLTEIGRYLIRAGWEEAWILARKRDIEELLGDSTQTPAVRQKLNIVWDARNFAAADLRLRTGESFTEYSQLERDTLVLVLSAAYRDRLAFHRWWFPIVGRVPYKGWFDFATARAQEQDFARRGFDTYLRPASAFSTLGWFDDPIVSTTLRADSLSLVNTVIHELLHNTFYASGQAEFNESFANFVGARGSREFFRMRGQRAVTNEADARWSDEKLLARFWRKLYGDIDTAFKSNPGDALMGRRLVLRDSIYRAARQELIFRVGPQLRTVAPRYVERVRLDNAALLSRRIYQTDLDLFDSVYAREGYDTRRAANRIIELARSEPKAPYNALRKWLATPRVAPAKAPAKQR